MARPHAPPRTRTPGRSTHRVVVHQFLRGAAVVLPPPHQSMDQSLHHGPHEVGCIDSCSGASGNSDPRSAALERHMLVRLRNPRTEAEQSLTKWRMMRKGEARPAPIELALRTRWPQAEGTHVSISMKSTSGRWRSRRHWGRCHCLGYLPDVPELLAIGNTLLHGLLEDELDSERSLFPHSGGTSRRKWCMGWQSIAHWILAAPACPSSASACLDWPNHVQVADQAVGEAAQKFDGFKGDHPSVFPPAG